MPPKARDAMTYAMYLDCHLDAREAARQLGVTVRTVKARVRRHALNLANVKQSTREARLRKLSYEEPSAEQRRHQNRRENAMAGKHKMVRYDGTVDSFLDCGDIESLRDEMTEWKDNMESNSMEHLPKYDEVSEAVDALDQAMEMEDSINSLRDELKEHRPEALTTPVFATHFAAGKRGQPRWQRLADAVATLTAACDEIETQIAAMGDEEATAEARNSLREYLDEVRNGISEAENCTFPGMF